MKTHFFIPQVLLPVCFVLLSWCPLTLSGQTPQIDSLKVETDLISERQQTFRHYINTQDFTRSAPAGLCLRDAILASGKEHQDLLLETYHLLIYNYHHRNLIDSALLIFREAISYNERRPPHWQMSEIYLRGAYLLKGSESDRLLDLSYQNSLLFKDTSNLAFLHYHAAEKFILAGGPEDSVQFNQQQALSLFHQQNDAGGVLLIRTQAADWHAKQGKTELALEGYRVINGTCKSIGFFNDYCNVCEYNLGGQFMKLGMLDSARWYIEQGLQRAIKRNDYGVIAQCHGQLAQVNEGLGDFEQAYRHALASNSFTERSHTTAIQAAIAEEKVRQNNEAALEEQEKAELQSQLLAASNRQYRTIGYGLLALMLLGGGLLWKLNRTRASLARSNAELEALNLTKDKFFGLIAHDLRGPIIALSSVGGQLKNLLRANRQEEAIDTAEQVELTSHRLSRLLDNLLQWALVKKGMIPHKPERLELADITDENIALFLDTAALKNITLSSDIEAGRLIYADARAVSTVLRNLINNALKFTPSGGVVQLAARTVEGGVELIVRDNGIGILPDKVGQLFQLASASSFGTAGEKGTGLGLILCQELISLNGGSIRVESTGRRGCAIHVLWPVA